jgi:putative endonuclease
MRKRFWVYIMSSKSGTLYTGMTNSLDRRVFEHKHHLMQGFTAKYDLHSPRVVRGVGRRSQRHRP